MRSGGPAEEQKGGNNDTGKYKIDLLDGNDEDLNDISMLNNDEMDEVE